MQKHYDAIIVGGRVAGSATAMLMARNGADVLVVDKAALGSDTLSTHALMRGAVDQLDRWGLLDRVVDAGTPAVTTTTFRYGSRDVEIPIEPLYAPRRTVLDPIMVEAASAAGAAVHHRTRVADIRTGVDGRVCGVELTGAIEGSFTTDLLVGADGLRSYVARTLQVPVTKRGRAANGSIAAYIEGADLPEDRYLWLNQPNLLGGVIPTNFGQHCVFVSMQPYRFKSEVEAGVEPAYRRLLAQLAPDVAAAVSHGEPVGPIRSWPGHVGQFRKAHGPGWALVGDAGYFKDPGAAHGITDAFRDAELLAHAAATGDFEGYERTRDDISAPLFAALDDVVDYSWTFDELQGRHMVMAKAMSRELKAFKAHLADAHRPAVAA